MDTDDTPENMALRLSGLVVKQQGKMSIYNPIYEKVFNEDWIDKQLSLISVSPSSEINSESKNIKFLMSMVHAKISCPARWQTNKNLPSLRIFALGQIYLNESGRELPNPILK